MEIKTAQDFLYQNYESHQYNIDNEIYYNERNVENMLIEFAKYHVTLALQCAVDKVELIYPTYTDAYINQDSIINAYPLDNIQ